jgi:hypothetical protein
MKWTYYGRTSGNADVYEIYRAPDNGMPFWKQKFSEVERLCSDGSWKPDPNKDAIWRELLNGEFDPLNDLLTEAEVDRLRKFWAKTKWPGRP